jgi:hypothetical protein
MSSILVHNQCSDFELVSPVYFGYNAIWHIPPDQKVDANTVTRASFGRNIAKDESASALIYKLQRKKCLESNDQFDGDSTFTEDTSTSLRLLVIWKSDDWLRSSVRALLIKHSNTITWNEDTLEKLHSMYIGLLRDDDIVKDIWLLDDATVLMTKSDWRIQDHATKITISEGAKENNSMEPLCVPSGICVTADNV